MAHGPTLQLDPGKKVTQGHSFQSDDSGNDLFNDLESSAIQDPLSKIHTELEKLKPTKGQGHSRF